VSDSTRTCFLPCCTYTVATCINEESVFICSNRWNGVSIHQIISYYKEHFVMSAYFTHGQVTHAAAITPGLSPLLFFSTATFWFARCDALSWLLWCAATNLVFAAANRVNPIRQADKSAAKVMTAGTCEQFRLRCAASKQFSGSLYGHSPFAFFFTARLMEKNPPGGG
jgi:hypothetical protein